MESDSSVVRAPPIINITDILANIQTFFLYYRILERLNAIVIKKYLLPHNKFARERIRVVYIVDLISRLGESSLIEGKIRRF